MPRAEGAEGRGHGGGHAKPSGTQLTRDEVWLNLWTYSRVKLGLTDREFYSYTPRQLDMLRKAYERQQHDAEFMLGNLTAAVVNFGYRRPTDAVKAADFMPTEIRKKYAIKVADVPMTPERRTQIAKNLRRSLNRVFAAFER
jgi:hypothetical protein